MQLRSAVRFLKSVLHRSLVVAGAAGFTLAFFLVLPLIQAINQPRIDGQSLQAMDTISMPPPPPPPQEEEPEEEEEEEPEPPELEEEPLLLDLSQLELALDPGLGAGLLGGDFAIKIGAGGSDGEKVDELFSMADLDQRPRVIYQPGPMITPQLRKKAPGTVYVIFVVNEQGRVQDAAAQKSTDPLFERPALAAVRQWKFEPGKRNGEPVSFRMRVPVTFPQDS